MRPGASSVLAWLAISLPLLATASCSSADESGSGGTATTTAPVVVRGGVEKGPLVLGSSVTVSPIDAAGNPTGASFKTQTTSDAGAFELTLPSPGPAAFEATGFQFNELTGKLSGAPITLRAYADLSADGSDLVYVNVVTHLGERRVRELLSQGSALAPAAAQADGEIQAAIQVGPSGLNQGTGSNQMTMLGGDTDPNAYLLAVSAVFLQAATEAAGPGGPVDGQLQELLNTFAQDLQDDGQIGAAMKSSLLAAQAGLDTAQIEAHLASRIAALGLADAVPDIDRILDQDQDGLVNVDDNCPHVANPDQADFDGDGFGDVCTPCGNGAVDNALEECDDGNLDDSDACLSTCVVATCGDGVIQDGVEDCDDANGDDLDGCDGTCKAAKCGDGVVQQGEECDDANGDDYDACTTKCGPPKCGDGITHAALGEACDDGNDIHGDGCFDCYVPVAIFAAGDRTCGLAVRSNAQYVLKCWGDNAHGALGQGDTENRGDDPGELEAMPPIDLGGPTEGISMGLLHNCGLVSGVGVKCWGRNTEGQLGLGDTQDRGDEPGEMGAALPVVLPPQQGGTVLYPTTGAMCSYGADLMKSFCWGAGAYGVLVSGSTASLGDEPAELPVSSGNSLLGFNTVAHLAFGYGDPTLGGNDHVCVRRDDGGVMCWGRNDFGQLGIGNTQSWGDDPGETITTLPVDGTALSQLTNPVTGRAHSCFWSSSLSGMVCFGANNAGQLGLGHTQSIGGSPGEVAALQGFQLSANGFVADRVESGIGADFNCTRLGGLWCWGDNSSGQLGRGNTENLGDQPGEMAMLQSLPGIPLGGDVLATTSGVALGRAHACTLLADGRMKCWGDNSKGQLGLGDTENRGDDPGEMGAALPFVPFP